jgi:hypothetical protein
MKADALKVGDRVRLDLDIPETKNAVGTVFAYPNPIIGGAEVFWDGDAPDLVRRGFRYCLPAILKAA